MAHPFFAPLRPLAIGHRGCAGEVPENTLASFERGIADGAVVLETDVHLTRDRVPVLLHDDDVARVTDGCGAVRDLSFATLCRLDAGFRFEASDGSTPYRGAGLRVPSLAEALEAFPGARFNLELKEERPELVERALAVIREANREELTLVTSGSDPLMQKIRAAVARVGSRVALGASAGEVARFVLAAAQGLSPPPQGREAAAQRGEAERRWAPAETGREAAAQRGEAERSVGPREGVMALQIPTHFAGQPLVTAALLAVAHAHGVQVHVWTINEPDEIAALLDLGVDGIVSDFPARVVRAAAQRARG